MRTLRIKYGFLLLILLKKVTGKELWISGKFDESVRNQLKLRGWKTREDAAKILIR